MYDMYRVHEPICGYCGTSVPDGEEQLHETRWCEDVLGKKEYTEEDFIHDFTVEVYYNIAADEYGRPAGFIGWKPEHPVAHEATFDFTVDDCCDMPTLAEKAFILLNQDDRPNGRTNRSMSVGDVVLVYDNSQKEGKYFACGSFRWDEIGEDDVRKATDADKVLAYRLWGTPAYEEIAKEKTQPLGSPGDGYHC